MTMILGGYISGDGLKRQQLPVTVNPNDELIDATVANFQQRSGVLTLRCEPVLPTGPFELALYADTGTYLLMLNEHNQDGEYKMRTYKNKSIDDGLITVLGEKYPSRATIERIDIVSQAFKEFRLTGDVTVILLA